MTDPAPRPTVTRPQLFRAEPKRKPSCATSLPSPRIDLPIDSGCTTSLPHPHSPGLRRLRISSRRSINLKPPDCLRPPEGVRIHARQPTRVNALTHVPEATQTAFCVLPLALAGAIKHGHSLTVGTLSGETSHTKDFVTIPGFCPGADPPFRRAKATDGIVTIPQRKLSAVVQRFEFSTLLTDLALYSGCTLDRPCCYTW